MSIQPPRTIRYLALALSAVGALLTGTILVLAVLRLAAGGEELQLPFVAAFEGVALAGCAIGLLVATGRLRTGPALALLVVGGMLLTSGALMEPALVAKVIGKGGEPLTLAGMSLVPFAIGQVVLGLAFGVLAALTVMVRRPARSFSYLGKGILLALPILLVAGLWLAGVGPRVAGLMPPVVFAPIAVLVGLVLIMLAAVSGHCLIRAVEVGLPEADEQNEPAATA